MSEPTIVSQTTNDQNPVSAATASSSEPIIAAMVEAPPTIDLTDDSGSGEPKNNTGT